MKKIGILVIISFVGSFILFFYSTKISFADCVPLNGINCRSDASHQTVCNMSTANYCCSSQPDCNTFLSNQNINPNVLFGAQDPAAACGGKAIHTAIGCIDFQDTTAFTGLILKWLVGIGGGVAFLLILSGAFTVMTSSGNPERLKQGQDVITAAVSGLILLIFSVFVLKFVGIDILGLGAFGFGP